MDGLFNILYFLVASDQDFSRGNIRNELLGLGGADGQIFLDTLLLTVPSAIVLAVIFYLVVNRFLTMNQIWLWLLFLVVAAAIGFQTAFGQLTKHIYVQMAPVESLGWKFIAHTVFIAILTFYLFSLLFKRWSPNAQHTPH